MGLSDTNFEHWACLDGIIKGLGGHSIDDEFARFAASVYTIDESNGDMWFCERSGYEGRCVGVGILSTGIPQGFGYPARNDFTPPMQGLRLNLDVTERKNHAPLTTFKNHPIGFSDIIFMEVMGTHLELIFQQTG